MNAIIGGALHPSLLVLELELESMQVRALVLTIGTGIRISLLA